MNKENFAFNERIIDEFRANEGKVAMFAGMPMIILHTIGRKSGKTLLVPLVLTVKKEDEMLLFGSFAGAKNDPAWVHNLAQTPLLMWKLEPINFRHGLTNSPQLTQKKPARERLRTTKPLLAIWNLQPHEKFRCSVLLACKAYRVPVLKKADSQISKVKE